MFNKDNTILMPSFKILILVFFFILSIIFISVFTNFYVILGGSIFAIVLLWSISQSIHLFDDIDVPSTETRSNLSIKNAISEIHRLFSYANEQVIIVSGSLNHKIWNNNQLINDLIFLVKRGIDIQILCGPKLEIEKDSLIYNFLVDSISKGEIKLYIREKKPESHLIIIDDTHIRLEKMHISNSKKREALIQNYTGSLAGRAKSKFEEYRMESDMVTKDLSLVSTN